MDDDGAEQVRRAEQIQLTRTMDAVGRLAGGIAHDFNNILTAVNGYAELALAGLAEVDPTREDIVEIRRAGERAAALTRRLLALGRRQVLTPSEVDPDAFLADLAGHLKEAVGDAVTVVLDLGARGTQVLVDPDQLREAILNVAAQAREAMPDGGRLTISTAAVDAPQDTGSDPALPRGRWLRVALADTGSGMDAETRSHVFEPFFATEPKSKGAGLALAMAWGIVTQSGGHLTLASEPGHGSTFRLYLPILEAGPDPEVAPLAESAPADPSTGS
jgi:two-component system, cell cycle sensor histidine kinase and response regulator CckA